MEEGIAIVEKKKDLYVFTYGNETILHREPNLLGKSINQFYKDEKENIYDFIRNHNKGDASYQFIDWDNCECTIKPLKSENDKYMLITKLLTSVKYPGDNWDIVKTSEDAMFVHEMKIKLTMLISPAFFY